MATSSYWIILIAAGAILVAIGNIQYNRVREIENKAAMAQEALLLLRPELQNNQTQLSHMRDAISKKNITLETFDTTAWQTVSNSELLLGLSNGRLPNLMRAYYLMNRANNLHSRILEMSIGVASALGGTGETKNLFIKTLSNVLEELQPILNS